MSLWGGRFSEASDEDLRLLNDSIDFDHVLYTEDIEGSMVYARALADAGVITHDEANTIIGGLQQVMQEFDADSFELAEGDEDIHTAVERRLTEIVGELGGKLHTGRSRNDQVATDFQALVNAGGRQPRQRIATLAVGSNRCRRGALRYCNARLHAPAAGAAD